MPCNILNGQKNLAAKVIRHWMPSRNILKGKKRSFRANFQESLSQERRSSGFVTLSFLIDHELVSQPKFLGCTDTYSAPLCALRASKNSPRCTMPACLSLKVMLHGTIRNARRLLEQHSVAMLDQCSNRSKQCRNDVATLCCAKNRRCESSLVSSP